MVVATSTHGSGTPPPPVFDERPVAEGPMRRELRRQIGRLERELARLKLVIAPWEIDRVTPPRGPALLDAAALEAVRDELLTALATLRRRFENTRSR
jgi:hypothetical protein